VKERGIHNFSEQSDLKMSHAKKKKKRKIHEADDLLDACTITCYVMFCFWIALFVGNWKTGWACEQLCRLIVSTAQ